MQCFEKVNENLGKIFTTLLPDASAKMVMNDYENPRTKEKYKGIEIKIAFDG